MAFCLPPDAPQRLTFGLLPKNVGVGNTINISIPKAYVRNAEGSVTVQAISPLRLLLAMAWFNSLPVDWLARFMVQIHISKTYLYRLPVPQPTDAEIHANPDYTQLAKNALLLSLAASCCRTGTAAERATQRRTRHRQSARPVAR